MSSPVYYCTHLLIFTIYNALYIIFVGAVAGYKLDADFGSIEMTYNNGKYYDCPSVHCISCG